MSWTPLAAACNVPVFRYALERWEADAYECVLFHHDPLTAAQQALLDWFETETPDGLANVAMDRVSLAEEMSPSRRILWSAQANATPPWMVVRYPRQMRVERPVWAGPLSAESVKTLLESPARRDIARRLLGGEAVIWLLLESGDQRADDEAARLVEAESRELEQTLILPEPSPLDPPMTANLPLKIAFSLKRVSRSDPAERMFVNVLLNWSPDLPLRKEPMLFPVFGRGRTVPPAIGEEIRPDALREMAEFLTGACSCEIKELNPGYDLLLTANWSSLVGYQEVMLPELPLVGMSQFAAPATNDAAVSQDPAAVSVATATAAPAVGRGNLTRNLLLLLASGVVFLTAVTLALRARSRRQSR